MSAYLTEYLWAKEQPESFWHRITSYNVCYTKLLRLLVPVGDGEGTLRRCLHGVSVLFPGRLHQVA